jgi:hypothetical protein
MTTGLVRTEISNFYHRYRNGYVISLKQRRERKDCHEEPPFPKCTSIWDLQKTNELKYMHMVEKLKPELTYLIKKDYAEVPNDLQLRGKGLNHHFDI